MKAMIPMKTMNITERLNYAQKPKLIIGDTELEVNNKATAILKALDLLESEDASNFEKIAKLLFDEEGYNKLLNLDLNFDDFSTVIISAMELISNKKSEGETKTRTTT